MKQEQASLEKASGGDAKKAEQYATKYMDGAKVENVYKTDDAGNFFLVDMKNKNGKDAKITVNNTGRILSEMEEIDRNDIPKPVSEAIDRLFSGEKVQRAYREETEYYQFQENTSGGDRVTIKIRPNGDVLSIHNPAAQQDDRDAAQTARSRESGSSDNKSSDRSNRNRNRGGGQ